MQKAQRPRGFRTRDTQVMGGFRSSGHGTREVSRNEWGKTGHGFLLTVAQESITNYCCKNPCVSVERSSTGNQSPCTGKGFDLHIVSKLWTLNGWSVRSPLVHVSCTCTRGCLVPHLKWELLIGQQGLWQLRTTLPLWPTAEAWYHKSGNNNMWHSPGAGLVPKNGLHIQHESCRCWPPWNYQCRIYSRCSILTGMSLFQIGIPNRWWLRYPAKSC